jgi:hypothetical protein
MEIPMTRTTRGRMMMETKKIILPLVVLVIGISIWVRRRSL